ncbi:MAG: ferritin [Spirochaetales bacterium]|nr:MAG: ferritin [Spirochaetales bacterium]
MTDALNRQFNEELNSAYIYNSMAADLYSKSLGGFGAWMTSQAAEERLHAEKIHRYMDSHGERVYYAAIPEPQAEWKTPLAVFQAALEHEKFISKCIHDLVFLARSENDLATESFLSWYVTEQVEEESTAQSIIDKLNMIGDNKYGLYQLDKELSTRQVDA